MKTTVKEKEQLLPSEGKKEPGSEGEKGVETSKQVKSSTKLQIAKEFSSNSDSLQI